MSLCAHLARSARLAAWKAGLVADRTAWAAEHVEHLLDTRGRALYEASGVPGLVVLVRFGAGRTIERCFGSARAAAPVRADTVFPALSLTKPVTAACVMALVDRGVLDLDEPVWRHVRDYAVPAEANVQGFDLDRITLRRLLSHGSGIRLHGHGFVAGRMRGPKELLEDRSADAHTLHVVEPAGTSLRYSGGGYLLAEMAIEGATGRAFPDVARETVLRPLGMASSDYDLGPALAARLATSHDAANRPLPARRLLATGAAGLYSTPADLTTFWSAFLPGPNGEPLGRGALSERACREMLAPQTEGADGVACGLGFYLRPQGRDRRYLHLGFFEGWDHHAEGLCGRGVVFTAMSNGDRGTACVPPLVRELRRTLYARAF